MGPRGGEAAQDIALDAIIHSDDMGLGIVNFLIAFSQCPANLIPVIAFCAAYFTGQIHAFKSRPVAGLFKQGGDVELS